MNQLAPSPASSRNVPALVATSGEHAARRFIDFFTSNIRNRNTREAYRRAVTEFLAWCEAHGVRSLAAVEPLHVATWIETLGRKVSAPTIKQKLAALRHLFDWLVIGQVVAVNPAGCSARYSMLDTASIHIGDFAGSDRHEDSR